LYLEKVGFGDEQVPLGMEYIGDFRILSLSFTTSFKKESVSNTYLLLIRNRLICFPPAAPMYILCKVNGLSPSFCCMEIQLINISIDISKK
jgi:hypothetical protein